ncbi:hypothetical protein [Halalkalibacter sp. APA_J-10(15)]|uniref:hypothetical protein n=1 Tax=Halalkalibacter sp. APA_J-10(15) TaxID=2933805 RepID=UPI001FF37EAC|nr:hypothetical protein [Halalkalibacter sp. APA_J-10(15)]MCK0473012.1 hypothetical protein [Halalkalibacter sp. APA_J-10(15)]
MSFASVKFSDVVKKQYAFKVRSYMGSILTLIFLQIIAIFLASSTANYGSHGSNGITITGHMYSSDMVLIFTFLWAVITAILLTTKAYRYDDHSYIATRNSSNLANVLYLLSASIFAGVTAMLSSFLIKTIGYFVHEVHIYERVSISVIEYMTGLSASVLYVCLFAMVGYVIGLLVQWRRLFIVVIPVLFIGSMFSTNTHHSNPTVLEVITSFIFQESSFLLFSVKIIVTCVVLFLSSMVISKQLEVRL